MPQSFSIQLNIAARRIVIIGGGRVAARKAAAVLMAGAIDVTAISPTFAADFPAEVNRIKGLYTAQALIGAFMVFAATNRVEVNDAVVRDARAIGALANRADADETLAGDFTTPAAADLGDIRITVSAGSAALSTKIRDRIVADFDPRWPALAAAMKTLRPWIVGQRDLAPALRAEIFRDLASDEAADRAGDCESLKLWIAQRYPEIKFPAPSPGNPGEGVNNFPFPS